MKFKNLFKIINLLFTKKIIFKSPKHFDLVVFDIKSLNDARFFFKKYNYFLMEYRLNFVKEIYISPKVLLKMIKNFSLGNIYTVYLLSLLEIINPKVVLTKVDNSLKFSEIAKIWWLTQIQLLLQWKKLNQE